MELKDIHALAQRIKGNVAEVIVGKEEMIDRLLIAMITSGHVLLEDMPGTGKTLLAKALAQSLHGTFKRVQFTPDLLPSDLSGIQFFNQQSGDFEFRPGPLFTNVLLADEINRATPRTQSSLLECMEERQVSIDGETHTLAAPFLVIATQNPVEHQGTFPLPEAQLDRFLFKLRMGYPSHEEGLAILKRFRGDNPLARLRPVAETDELLQAQAAYTAVRVSDDVLDYLLRVVELTRTHESLAVGVSPRGSQALLRAVQAHAVLQGRDYATPDDVKAMAEPVLAHRVIPVGLQRSRADEAARIVAEVLERAPVPAEEPVR
ncbi:MoxR family ATPase [Paenibacillus sp. IB182496]|uniref:MoxR family ATPase n=1 Tax=Paenibacillus sabuli TaxID=2772509 RepID=A0A927GU41_9BACL|nr:MoxR family ATPase [Paenibacillus sabuli]MBD2847755.1 MoxR family ATPase [Paenibacillus sabuli]